MSNNPFENIKSQRLPAEWEPQSFIQLTWPHADTDWAPYLADAYKCYLNIASEIVKREALLIVTPEPAHVRQLLAEAGILPQREGDYPISFFQCPTNDTWARDHGFITTLGLNGKMTLHDFCFNGWGMKFAADKDNMINEHLFETTLAYAEADADANIEPAEEKDYDIPLLENVDYQDDRSIVLEGGSIESDGNGTFLTTSECLLADNRNYYLIDEEASDMLCERLHADRVMMLHSGYLAGDDTDSHVDTLARLCPNDTIVYVQCQDTEDEHYQALNDMEQELMDFTTSDGRLYRLLPLPLPTAIYDGEDRLPATYANFLIMNGAVLVPTYGQADNDAQALDVIAQAFPDREIVGIDCQVLIRQHGSLHCITMQYPEGVVLNQK